MKLKNLPFEDLTFSYFGPDLFWGAMPTVFYFTIDAHSSLVVDPFNQPVVPMLNHSMRVFSVDLPEHGSGLDPHTALSRWAISYENGQDILKEFLDKVCRFIDHLQHEQVIDHRLGALGLSRGAFIAAHLAAICPKIKHIVGFAPLTDLTKAKEFQELPQNINLPKPISTIKEGLLDCSIKFYIGNHDTRVSTERAITTIMDLCHMHQAHSHKSPPVEAVIYPSVGHMGHGTPPQIFEAGSLHILQKLGFMNGL